MAPVNDRPPRKAGSPDDASAMPRILDELLRLATQTAHRLDHIPAQAPAEAQGDSPRSPSTSTSTSAATHEPGPSLIPNTWEDSLQRIVNARDVTPPSDAVAETASRPAFGSDSQPEAAASPSEFLDTPTQARTNLEGHDRHADSLRQVSLHDLFALTPHSGTSDVRQNLATPVMPHLAGPQSETDAEPGWAGTSAAKESRSVADAPSAQSLAGSIFPSMAAALDAAHLDHLSAAFFSVMPAGHHPTGGDRVEENPASQPAGFDESMQKLRAGLEPPATPSAPGTQPTNAHERPTPFSADASRFAGESSWRFDDPAQADPATSGDLGSASNFPASPFSSPLSGFLSQPLAERDGGLAGSSTSNALEPSARPLPSPLVDTSLGPNSDSGRDTDLLRLQLEELRLTNQMLRQDQARPLPAEPRGGRPCLAR